jgi:FKBP-type peptidyl-prolyl cis-trans isomerase FklB
MAWQGLHLSHPFVSITHKETQQMKYIAFVALSVVLLACESNTQNKADLKTTEDSVSYIIGTSIGRNLKAQKVQVSLNQLARGIQDAMDSSTLLITDEQAQRIMGEFQQQMIARQEEEAHAAGEIHRKEGEAFLAENKTKAGVKVTASGLQYKVIKMGTGPKPRADQTVTVHYSGRTIDGKEFDSSYKRGEPTTFGVGQVIKGWTEALQLMPVGSKWELYIPADLAYGDRGAGQLIPPGATLIFEVELLSVK